MYAFVAEGFKISDLPSKPVTFLFTDIEGFARSREEHPEETRLALEQYRAAVREKVEECNGHVFEIKEEVCSTAFSNPLDAITASCEIQKEFVLEKRSIPYVIKIRIAIHCGDAARKGRVYSGPSLQQTSHLLAVGRGGQILLSQDTAEQVKDKLPGEISLRNLGVQRLRNLTSSIRIFQVLHSDFPDIFPLLKALPIFPNNLPLQSTSFIGREKEMAEAKRLLRETRLLALVGAGGSGKTRLALQVAADLLEDYPHGTWFVDLAPIHSASLVPESVAASLGIRTEPHRPMEDTLFEHLRSRHLLLILDNCEHLTQACAEFAGKLLENSSHVRILATSREPLRILGEMAWPVPPLSFPEVRQRLPLEAITGYEAVQLFADRAKMSNPLFRLTQENVFSVVQICHQLDGIPLAIELAAAYAKEIPVEEIASKLNDCFKVLTKGSLVSPSHYKTLHSTIDWSYDLLSSKAQVLFRRLSIFLGGFSPEAAECVCSGNNVEEHEVSDLLSLLVEKSLVVAEGTNGTLRYRLLETIRQYGLEKLQESGEMDVLRNPFLNYFVELAEKAEPSLLGPEQARWFDLLEAERANFGKALEWCQEEENGIEKGLRLAGSLKQFWLSRGCISGEMENLVQILSLSRERSTKPTHACAKALYTAAGLARFYQGNFSRAYDLCQESLAISRELGDKLGAARALNGLGILAGDQGRYQEALSLLGESLSLRKELGDKRMTGVILNNLGFFCSLQSDYKAASSFLQESLAIAREVMSKVDIAVALQSLGEVSWYQGNYKSAHSHFKESLAISQELGNKLGIALTLASLGILATDERDFQHACSFFQESLALSQELMEVERITWCLLGFARLACATESNPSAAILFGAGSSLSKIVGYVVPPNFLADCEEKMEKVRDAMGQDAYMEAWKKGSAMTLDQAVQFAKAFVPAVHTQNDTSLDL